MFKGKVFVSSICFLLDHLSEGPFGVWHWKNNCWCVTCAPHWYFLFPILSLVLEWMRVPFVLLVDALAGVCTEDASGWLDTSLIVFFNKK